MSQIFLNDQKVVNTSDQVNTTNQVVIYRNNLAKSNYSVSDQITKINEVSFEDYNFLINNGFIPEPSNLVEPSGGFIDLDAIAVYLRQFMPSFRNSNFWAYTCDGDVEGNFINDGGDDMFDTGNFVTPWLLSGQRYDLDSTSLSSYPYHISYSTTSSTVVDENFNYVSLGWIYEPDTDNPQIDQSRHPITVLGFRPEGAVGWQIGGEIGADGGGTAISGNVYSGNVVNGFTVHSGYRQIYDAGDPTICHLVILLGHPNWSSQFGSITMISDNSDTDYCQFVMHSGSNSKNILAIYTLLSKPNNDDNTPISTSELQQIVNNFTLRISQVI